MRILTILPLIAIHLLSRRLASLDQVPRSRILSFSGGVAVSLVFLEILPQLAEHQEVVRRALGESLLFLKHHIYLVALIGLATFYAADRAVKTARQQQHQAGLEDEPPPAVFALTLAVYGTKNAIVGYVLSSESWTMRRLILFLIAISLEFVLSDRALHHDHPLRYDRYGRWVLAGVIVAGYALGTLGAVPPLGYAILSAFLGGAIILTTLKEELPDERQSSVAAFVTGMVVYGILALAR